MRKFLSVLAITLLYAAAAFGQGAVDIQVTISDNAPTPNSKQLRFGLDHTATNGIDVALGESDLPPFPPAGAFEARFDLQPYAGEALSSYWDYRNAPAPWPFTGNRQYRLWWQLGEGASSLTVAYNMPGNATLQIQDLFGGVLVNSPILTGTGNYVIAVPLDRVNFNIAYQNIPVELTSFTGVQKGTKVQLNWITATETNNSGFELQRNIENAGWEKVTFIEGKGTTTEIQNYSFADDFKNNPITGKVVYRLKQIDFDGTFAYSNEISVAVNFIPNEYTLSQNYPNPFNPSTAIRYSLPYTSNVKIVIYNMIGEVVSEVLNQVQETGYYDFTWNASNLSSGIYFYSIEANSLDGKSSFQSIKKMTLLK